MFANETMLPTPIAQIVRRSNLAATSLPVERFMKLSYVFEALLKTLASVLIAGVANANRDAAYRLIHQLLRTDGLGDWDAAIRASTSPPLSGQIPREFVPVLRWITQKRNKPDSVDFQDPWKQLCTLLAKLGLPSAVPIEKVTVRDFLVGLIQVRNKRAHGAFGDSDYSLFLPFYEAALAILVRSCPFLGWKWFYRFKQTDEHIVTHYLAGNDPHSIAPDSAVAKATSFGLLLVPDTSSSAFDIPPLISCDPECRDFYFANGTFRPSDTSVEFLSYFSGATIRLKFPAYATPPAPLPKSETHGSDALDIQSNVFGNLPDVPSAYIHRSSLQEQLLKRLRDKNHPIITLHGRGGVGKTSLALYAARFISNEADPTFDQVLWLSARDIDLSMTGPKVVRQNIVTLEDIADKICGLLSQATGIDALALILQDASNASAAKGTLFIFDNFETLESVKEIHEFLDTHTHLPNKVLITSRERAFKADFPIEVFGMERPEAKELALRAARDLSIEPLITDAVFDSVYSYTQGHPYLIKVMVGEIAKDGRFIAPPQLMGRRDDIIDALFERSFNKLSDAARSVFLVVSNWKSLLPEFLLEAVLGQRGVDVRSGLDECRRQSLLETYQGHDDVDYVAVPHVARLFGEKKLKGESDRMVIEADLALVAQFGSISLQSISTVEKGEIISQFFTRLLKSVAHGDPQEIERANQVLASIAELWPYGWLTVAQFRASHRFPSNQVAYAYRRAMEENPFDPRVLDERAEYSRKIGDDMTEISCLIQLVELRSGDVPFVSQVAGKLVNFVTSHKDDIPQVSRTIFVASVRQRMLQARARLDATGLSRLAWLFLVEGNEQEAKKYALEGYKLDKSNSYCRKLLEMLKAF